MVLMIPLNSIVADKMKAYQKEQMAKKDVRKDTHKIHELINAFFCFYSIATFKFLQ